jgi:hypothetical protein
LGQFHYQQLFHCRVSLLQRPGRCSFEGFAECMRVCVGNGLLDGMTFKSVLFVNLSFDHFGLGNPSANGLSLSPSYFRFEEFTVFVCFPFEGSSFPLIISRKMAITMVFDTIKHSTLIVVSLSDRVYQLSTAAIASGKKPR